MSRNAFLFFVILSSACLFVFSPVAVSDEAGAAFSQAPEITSKTHPDPEKWYPVRNAEFSWALPSDVDEVSYLVTDKPASNPGGISDGLKNGASFSNVSEGVHYLHVKFHRRGSWGSISHFKFQIDATPPLAFQVSLAGDAAGTARPLVVFSTMDALSGVERYVIRVDDGLPILVGTENAGVPFRLPNILQGAHAVTVTAVDRAGNSTSAQINVETSGFSRPVIKDAPHRVSSGGAVEISGKAPAESIVSVYIAYLRAIDEQPDADGIIKIVETLADSEGSWAAAMAGIPDGDYKIRAYAQYADGSTSLPSEEVVVRVGGLAVSGIFMRLEKAFAALADWQQRWFVQSIVVYTVLAMVLARYVLPRIAKGGAALWGFRRKKARGTAELKAELKSKEGQMKQELIKLHGDVSKELRILHDIGRHRALYPDERYLRTKLTQYLKVLNGVSSKKRR